VSYVPEKKHAKAKKISEKKKTAPVKQRKKPSSMLEPYRPSIFGLILIELLRGSGEILRIFFGRRNVFP